MFVTALLAATLAAPVPKTGPKLADLFGEPTEAKGKCTFEMDRAGVLTVTVPNDHPPSTWTENAFLTPLLAKTVDGDFVLTVRLTLSPAEGAGENRKNRLPSVGGGVAVRAASGVDVGAVAAVERRRLKGVWGNDRQLAVAEAGPGGKVEGGIGLNGSLADGPIRIRLTRRGEELTVEWAEDGKKWEKPCDRKLTGLTGAVTVGPVAFQSTDKEFIATFDEYTIEPLKK